MLVGITSILKEAWNISNNAEADKREKIHALSLAKECYSMKLELLTNSTVVDDAIRFTEQRKEKLISKQENKESKESDCKEEDSDRLQEKKKEGKRTEKNQTTNLIF